MQAEMFFAAAVTREPVIGEALLDLEQQAIQQLGDRQVDLVFVFFSEHFRGMARRIRDELSERLHPGHILGCTGEGIIGMQDEVEQTPAIALLAACLPGVGVSPFHLQPRNWTTLLENGEVFRQEVNAPPDVRLFLLVGDPFSTPMEYVLQVFNEYYPGIPVAGGMASAAMAPGQNALLVDEWVSSFGLVGVALSGAFDADLVVSQGCRPIGMPLTVTSAQKNVIRQLDNHPPLYLIQDMVERLPEEEQSLLRRGLLIGRAIETGVETPGRGDFLIRGVIGADRQSGAITISDTVEPGEVVQFHVRDAVTAQEDLEMLLIPQAFRPQAFGALLFSCNGRGSHLFDYPNGDVSVVQKNLGGVPLAGFFCAGELGPVHKKNYLHGHTVSLVLFRPATG
jgi:small ligand-binding sensory domain FIST